MLIHFIAWAMARHPDGNFIYVSYSHSLAKKQTATIRQIVELPMYKYLFGVQLRDDASAKDNFENTHGGSVYAAGAGGSITGRGAGIKGSSSFGGCIVIDDIIKPDEACSDTIREGINEWFYNTLQSRINSPSTPIIFIGQRLHEDDLAAHLIATGEWETVIIPAVDMAGNALHPEMHDVPALRRMQETMPYEFAAQYQQDPQPAGGGIFRPEWFVLHEHEPDIMATFITADTAETASDWNDATVFSFWGVYRIRHGDILMDELALHVLDCMEIRVEPKDLENEFMQFYAGCMRHRIKPSIAGIEVKSTGVTLASLLKKYQGLRIIDIERTKATGGKTARFLEAQPYVASGRISLPAEGRHTRAFIEHMRKITANDSHRNDDICYVRGSKIATIKGYVNIEDVKTGDRVITPFGLGKVRSCGSTGIRPVIKNIGLEGTANHPVFYKNVFLPLITVPDMTSLDILSLRGLLKWKIKRLFVLMESNTGSHHRQDIINLANKDIGISSFIGIYGNFIAKGKYLKIMLSITRMATGLIMTIVIWSVFRLSNIVRFISRAASLTVIVRKFLRKCGKNPENTGKQMKERKEGEKLHPGHLIQKGKQLAVFVQKILLPSGMHHICVLRNADGSGQTNGQEKDMQGSQFLNQNVHIAKTDSWQDRPSQKNITAGHVQEHAPGDMVMQEVFNLTVENDGVYYANDILVSNCDTMYDAIRLALIDNVVVRATTVKPDYAAIAKGMGRGTGRLDRLRKDAYR